MTPAGGLAAVLAALALSPGGGEEAVPAGTDPLPVYTVEPIRVEAERERRSTPTPGARTVLDRAWLDARDPVSLSGALLPVPGLRLRGFGDGVSSFASVRGLGAQRVAVLVDGRPLNTAQGGGVDLQPLDVEGLERVELHRGSMGAVFGPDAFAGAVNLVRRDDRRDYVALRALGGSGERGLARASFGAARERWDVEGAARVETAEPDLDGLRASSRTAGGWLRLAHRPDWAASIEAGVEARGDERDLPGSRAFPTPGAERDDRFAEGYLALRDVFLGPGAAGVEVSRSRQTRSYRDPQAPLGALDDTHRNDRTRAAATWRSAARRADVTVRAEAVRDDLDSTTDGVRRRDRAGAGAHAVLRAGAWAAAPSLRVDAVQGFAPALGGRLTLTREWAVGGAALGARLGGGSGFRPPTFDDLFWPARASAAGNPDLRPERSWDLDAGLTVGADGLRAELSGFLTRVDDLIQWTPGGDGVWRPHNVGRARLAGVEAGVGWRTESTPWPVEVNASYTFTDARDATDDPVTGGMRLVGRAPHRAYAETLFRPGRWTVGGGLDATGRVPLTAANTKYQDGYVLFHALARYRLSDTVRLDLEGRNLADTDYEDLRGYATPGREILVGFRVTP